MAVELVDAGASRRGADGHPDAGHGRARGDAPRWSRLDGAPKIIVLTTFDADEYVARALGGGASGFLLKDTPPADLVEAVRKVAAGTRSCPRVSPRR